MSRISVFYRIVKIHFRCDFTLKALLFQPFEAMHFQTAMEWGTEDQDGTIKPESLADNCTLAELKELFIKKNVVGRSKSTDKLVLAKILCSEAKTMIVTKSENGEEDRKAIIPVMIQYASPISL